MQNKSKGQDDDNTFLTATPFNLEKGVIEAAPANLIPGKTINPDKKANGLF